MSLLTAAEVARLRAAIEQALGVLLSGNEFHAVTVLRAALEGK